jgi:murein DD-endopeptidase MepM/ murein hydrolase activator NlpD
LPVALVVAAWGLSGWIGRVEGRADSPLPLAAAPRYQGSLASLVPPGDLPLPLDRVSAPRPFAIGRGQTLGGLFGELGLTPAESHAAVTALAEHVEVRKIRAGEEGIAYFDSGSELAALQLTVAGKGWVEVARRGDGWSSSWHEFVREERIRRLDGELEDFLESAIRAAGGPPQLAFRMADVLQWDLDFHRDLRIGDRFRVLFEEVYLDGRPAGVGRVIALAYENRGELFEAYRYGDGYYDGQGRPLQKMFLRSPLAFSRVTSRFSHSRFHPVLKIHRPHYGVDYGAPVGTPVRVTANGVVSFAGRSGGAGNMVKVRHPKGYLTAYLHLSGFASGIRSGKRVSQGDVVGYVGSTGLATGPHLDYRVQKSGRWIDPLKLTNQPAEPIPPHLLADFLHQRERLRAELGGDWPAPAEPEEASRVARHAAAATPLTGR